MSFRGPVFIVVVFAVDRLGPRRRSFTTSWQTHCSLNYRPPATLFTASDAAAPGPVVLSARPGSESVLLAVNRVSEQASAHFGDAGGKWQYPCRAKEPGVCPPLRSRPEGTLN